MSNRRIYLWAVALLFGGMLAAVPQAGFPASVQHPSICGPAFNAGGLTNPPEVVVSEQPLDAQGEHELILAVHSERGRYCYRFVLNGAVQTQAPSIHVQAGEHFALRIVNDISGASRGESVASTALPKCGPAQMPMNAPIDHYDGYLNHVMDDRYMSVKPADTNIHLHGFQGPALQENVFLSTLSTPMHACEYRITIPKTQPPGTYFYHPHVHGASEAEMGGGLTGVWIVDPTVPQIAASADHVLLLQYELPFKADNPFAPANDAIFDAGMAHLAALHAAKPAAYDPFNPPAWPLSVPVKAGGVSLPMNSCDGFMSEAVVSVNGFRTPAALSVPAGQTQLLRVVNATTDSPKMLLLRDESGKVVPMRVAELDGVPLSGDSAHPLARYEQLERVMIPPASRASILVTAAPGETLVLSSGHFCEGIDAFYQLPHDLVEIRGVAQSGADPPAIASRPVNENETPAARLLAYARANSALIRRRAITFTEYVIPKHGSVPVHSAFFITDTSNRDFHEHPFWPVYRAGGDAPVNPDIVVKRGTIEEWYIFNATMESHAFHIHQMTFVEEQGPGGAPATVDTVFVPVGKLLPNPRDAAYPLVHASVTRAILDFRNVPRGTFVFHCHMLFHEDHGMMGTIRVE